MATTGLTVIVIGLGLMAAWAFIVAVRQRPKTDYDSPPLHKSYFQTKNGVYIVDKMQRTTEDMAKLVLIDNNGNVEITRPIKLNQCQLKNVWQTMIGRARPFFVYEGETQIEGMGKTNQEGTRTGTSNDLEHWKTKALVEQQHADRRFWEWMEAYTEQERARRPTGTRRIVEEQGN